MSKVITPETALAAFDFAFDLFWGETVVPIMFSLVDNLTPRGEFSGFGFSPPIIFFDGSWTNQMLWRDASYDAIERLFYGLFRDTDLPRVWVNRVRGFENLSPPIGYPNANTQTLPEPDLAPYFFRNMFLDAMDGYAMRQDKQRVKGIFFAETGQTEPNVRLRDYRRFPYREARKIRRPRAK